MTYQAYLGGFRHLTDVDPGNLKQVGINNYIIQTLGIFAFGSGKVSVGCLILRLLPPNSVWRKWIIWTTIIFVFVFDALNCVLTFVQCSPPRALWEPDTPHSCWDPSVQTKIAFGGTGKQLQLAVTHKDGNSDKPVAYNIFVDAMLALLPVTIIWKLNMSLRKRLELCFLLGLGLLYVLLVRISEIFMLIC